MTESIFKISRPFGPSLGMTVMPQNVIDKINKFIDEDINPNPSKVTDLDHGGKLVGQVNQEIKLPKEIIDGEYLKFQGYMI